MNGLPRWVVLPAALGALLVVLPVASLLTRVDIGSLWPLLTSPGARDALWLSLRTSVVATLLCVVLGVPLALLLARASFPGRRVVRALLLLPLVLPPVVGGLALLTLLGRSGLLGGALDALGMRVPFTTAAVVLAQAFVALPFLVLTLDGALRSHDTAHEDVAATLGARPTRVLLRVTLPALAPALVSGTVLAFARALGEFGATITFAGALQGVTQTLPLEIYLQRSSDPDAAVALSLVLVVVALVIIVAAYGPWFQAGEGGGPGARSGDAGSAGERSADARSADVRLAVARSPGDGSAAHRSTTGAPPPQPHEPGGRLGSRGGARPPSALSLRVRVPERGVDVALDVPAGEVVAVLGPNGAGKSTLLQAVAGLGDLGGEITVALGGRLVAEPGTRPTPPRDRRVGWLGQRALLLRHASVGDNVAFGPVSRGMRRSEARALAHALLSEVGAAHLAARRPHELSGGQAQRIAIARALATDPDVLLVDEPFSALDVGAAQHARLLLQAAHRSAPRTTLLVTHDLLDVAQLADRVVVIEDGRVVEDGPATEVLTRPRSTFGGRFAGVNLLVGRVVAPTTGLEPVPSAGTAEAGTARVSGAVLATSLGEVHGTAEDLLEAHAEAVALFEPRAVSVHRDPPGGSPRNAFSVVLTGIEPHGSLLRVWADAGQDHREVADDDARSGHGTGTGTGEGGVSVRIAADLTPAAVAELSLVPGERLWFVVKAAEVTVLPR